jgi:hypothetical protein
MPNIGKKQYIKTHDIVCAQLHLNICKEIDGNWDSKHWDDHAPKSDETSYETKVTILCKQHVRNDRTIPNNKSDIINPWQ